MLDNINFFNKRFDGTRSINWQSLWSKILVVCLITLAVSYIAAAQTTIDPTPQFRTNDRGVIAIVGNSSMSCPDTDANCADAREGLLLPPLENDDDKFVMTYMDIDSDPSTFNSSSAQLDLPPGAVILWAGLYWGGDTNSGANTTGAPAPNAAQRDRMLLQTPVSAGYQTFIGDEVLGSSTFEGNDYAVFLDATNLVAQGGSGVYTVANIQAGTGNNRYAGWSLVVVYRAPGLPPRNLAVFDGFADVTPTSPDVVIPITGFTTPLEGEVRTRVGIVTFEGDFGLEGDTLELNDVLLFDSTNPPTNAFNSSLSNEGVLLTDRTPNFRNSMGLDVSIYDTNDILNNNATSAEISLQTDMDAFFPVVVTFSTDLFLPQLNVTKNVTDINGGVVERGDILEYEVAIANPLTGLDTVTLLAVNDPIPANTSYVTNSLQVLTGPNAGIKSDVAGDDQAEFSTADNQVTFRLGDGADAIDGGDLPVGESTSFRFRVQVNQGTPGGTQITNVVTTNFTGLLTGISNTIDSNPVTSIVQVPELTITKTSAPNPVEAGAVLVYTLTFGNTGTAPATGVVISDVLPANTSFISATGGGVLNGNSIIWNIGTLRASENGSVSYIVQVASPLPDGTTITNSAVIESNQTPPVPTQTQTPVTSAPVLTLTKLPDRTTVSPGEPITYTLTYSNIGNGVANNVVLTDPVPANTTFVSASNGGIFDSASNTVSWNIGVLPAGASGTVGLVLRVNDSAPAGTVIENTAVIAPPTIPPVISPPVTVIVNQPVLNLSKVAGSTVVEPASQLSYTLNASNTGNAAASGVVLSDTIPSNTTFVAATGGGTFDAASNSVVWNVGSLAAGASVSFNLTVQVASSVPSGTPIVNTATLTSTQLPPVTTQTQTPVASLPILTLDKQADSEAIPAGTELTYTLTFSNIGNVAATGVVLADLIPLNTTFVAAGNSGVFDPATNIVTWNLGNLAVGASSSVTITVRVDETVADGTLIINIGDIVSNETPPIVALALTPVGIVTVIIPTLGTLGLLMLAILLGVFGTVKQRYRWRR